MISSLFFTAYLGYLTTLERCVGSHCEVIKNFTQKPCVVKFEGMKATVFGVTYPVQQILSSTDTQAFQYRDEHHEFTMYFRPLRKPVRAFISEATGPNAFERLTCEFFREHEIIEP